MGFKLEIPRGCHFTIENIPFGVISAKEPSAAEDDTLSCATAIGDYALNLRSLAKTGFFQDSSVEDALTRSSLNAFAALPVSKRTKVRASLISALKRQDIQGSHFRKLEDIKMHLPLDIPGYTDFYCSLEHCQNCAPMNGGKFAENVLKAPSAYNGRASSVITSPSVVHRPKGVFWKPGTREAVFGTSQMMDYELEMGYIVSNPVPYGERLDVNNAADHIFGFVLLNDWSSRDIQSFEMTPLGPFNGKAFATQISPWVITLEALAPFRCPAKHLTQPLQHLRFADLRNSTFDIKLAAYLERKGHRQRLCTSNLRYLYWTPYQQLAHHASSGCGLKTGDLMGTGTISGDGKDDKGEKYELGCLFEATQHASEVIRLDNGDQLRYLEDGDIVTIEAWCEDGTGRRVLGFGECRGEILPSI